jgi:hypothetical protein
MFVHQIGWVPGVQVFDTKMQSKNQKCMLKMTFSTVKRWIRKTPNLAEMNRRYTLLVEMQTTDHRQVHPSFWRKTGVRIQQCGENSEHNSMPRQRVQNREPKHTTDVRIEMWILKPFSTKEKIALAWEMTKYSLTRHSISLLHLRFTISAFVKGSDSKS